MKRDARAGGVTDFAPPPLSHSQEADDEQNDPRDGEEQVDLG